MSIVIMNVIMMDQEAAERMPTAAGSDDGQSRA